MIGSIDSKFMDDMMPAPASVTTTVIGGKTFVSGLLWRSLANPRSFKKEAQEIGKREGMDIVTIRHTNIIQAGFAPKGQGAGKGMYSLAAALAGKLGNSFIGVFELGQGRYAFLAVHDGAIVPSSDFIGDRESVEERLRYFYGNSTFNQVYTPANFDFGGEEASIQDVLGEGSFTRRQWSSYQLRPLKFGMTRAEMVRLLIFIALGLLLLVGFQKYREYQEEQDRLARIKAEIARKQEAERIQAMTKKGKTVQEVIHPWVKEPSVDDFVKECSDSINRHPLSIGGWLFESATCDGVKTTAWYRRVEPGTAESFSKELKLFADSVPTFTSNFDTATITQQVNVLLSGDDPLVEADVALADYGSSFQTAGLQVNFVQSQAEAKKPAALPGQHAPAEAAQELPPPQWKTYTFAFDGEKAPATVFAGRQWTGVRLTKIGVKLAAETASLSWSINGKLYAK